MYFEFLSLILKNYFNIIVRKMGSMQRRVSLPEDVVSFTSLPISQKEKMVDVAFKQIS